MISSIKKKNFFEKKINLLLSPSDVGPQNILKEGENWYFIDFEYSGIDSNLKLGLDLICHPDLNFFQYKNNEITEIFIKKILRKIFKI